MVIRFKSIHIQGFMSIGHERVDLEDRGLVLVRGKNLFEPLSASNGSGKSAIFESIIWTLTGTTSRNSGNVINKYTSTGTLCELTMLVDSTEYFIRRTDKHSQYGSSLTIIKDGEDISGNTKTKSKKVLETELPSLTYDLLTSIIVLSQGLPGRLSSLKPSQRKARLEQLSSADYYLSELDSRMSSVSKDLNASKIQVMTEISRCEGILSSSQRIIQDNTSKITEIANKQGNLIDKDTAKSYQEDVTQLESSIHNITLESEVTRSECGRVSNELYSMNHRIEVLKSQLSEISGRFSALHSTGQCPTCKRELTDQSTYDELSSKYTTESVTIKATLGELIESVSKLTEYSEECNNAWSNYMTKINELTAECNMKKTAVMQYTQFSDTTEYLKEAIETNTKIVEKCNAEILEFKSRLNELTELLNIHGYIKRAMSKKFRSFLLEGTVEYLNSRCSIYSSSLFEKQGVVNLEIKGNDINIKLGDDTYFEELSGGESRRVDLILQLAQRDLARNESGFSSNLLVMDEVLDYLDTSGVESVMNLIESKSDDIESILVVSHKTDARFSYDSKLTVIKDTSRVSRIE